MLLYFFPVPAWSFAIYINNILIPGSSSGSFSITPDDLVVHDSADFIYELKANDMIKIVNTANMPVDVVANPTGSSIPIASARLNLVMIKELL